MKADKAYQIKAATYLDGYRLRILFGDGKTKIVDFSNALNKYAKNYCEKYKNLSFFKKFKVENDNLVWGKDWDLIFEQESIRDKTIETNP